MDTEKMQKETGEEVEIEIDIDKAHLDINKRGCYEKDGLKLEKWQGDKDSEYYVASIKKEGFAFSGVLNSRFKRHNYGINSYDNGDVFFGCFENDLRDSHGAYLFKPKIQNGQVLSECYYGLWKNNTKDHHGIYLWLKQKINTNDFDNSDFDAYVGDIEFQGFKRGCYFTKSESNFYVYYGGFETNGTKTDNKAFLYDNQKDRVFCGKILKDKFVNGYLMFHNEEGKFASLVYVEFDDNQNPIDVTSFEDIDETVRNEMVEGITKFRTIIFEEDSFIKIYQKWVELKSLIDVELSDTNVYHDDKIYPRLMKIASAHNDVSLYRKLQKSMIPN